MFAVEQLLSTDPGIELRQCRASLRGQLSEDVLAAGPSDADPVS